MLAAIELVVTEFVLLAVACFFLLRYYAASMVSLDVFVAVYVSWVLGFASVLFLPYDLSVAIVDNERSPSLERVWQFVYWSTFILAWAVLPIQMEYHSSGHFSFKEKMWDAVYRLLFAGLIAIVAGVIYIVYLVSTSGGTFAQVLGFVMAMGNTYGVLLITLLMGNGLVALPMHLWRLGDIERGLRELYLSAAFVEEAFQDARYEMEDCEVEVQKIRGLVEKSGSIALRQEIGPFLDILSDKIASFQFAQRSKARSFVRGFQLEQIEENVLTSKAHIVKLHARLMTAQIKARASERRWNVLISECERQQLIAALRESRGSFPAVEAAGSSPTRTSSSVESPSLLFSLCNPWTWKLPDCCRPYCESLYVLWSQRMYTHSCRAAAVICGLMSVLILWCEMLMSSHVDSPVGLMMTAYDYQASSSVMVQAVSFVALMYMSMCTYWPLFRINVGWSYKLQGPQQSSPFSLIFNAEYLSRLQFTIGYNFLMFLNVPKANNTAFNQLMKNIDLIPVFGTSFAVYIPLIMLIVALLTLFDGYGRLVKMMGIEWEEATSDGHNGLSCTCRNRDQDIELDPQLQEKIRTGKLIVSNEVKQRRAAQELTTGRDARTLDAGPAKRPTNLMRIGVQDLGSAIPRMTESLMPSQGRYRNVDTTPDTDLELDLSDHHRSGYVRPGQAIQNTRAALEMGSKGSGSSNADMMKNALFGGFSGGNVKEGGYGNVPQQASPTLNPMGGGAGGAGGRKVNTDLFSIDNSGQDNIYGGRYSDV